MLPDNESILITANYSNKVYSAVVNKLTSPNTFIPLKTSYDKFSKNFSYTTSDFQDENVRILDKTNYQNKDNNQLNLNVPNDNFYEPQVNLMNTYIGIYQNSKNFR